MVHSINCEQCSIDPGLNALLTIFILLHKNHNIQEENSHVLFLLSVFSALGLSQVGRECLLLLESTFVTEICQDARK